MHSAALFLVLMAVSKKMVSVRNNKLISRAVKDVLNSRVEHKRATTVVAAANWATAGAVIAVSQFIVQGDDIANRSGDTIYLENVKVRINSVYTDSGTGFALNAVVRVILFSDNMDTGTVPAVTDVLQSASQLSGFNQVSKQAGRFKIYFDESWVHNADTWVAKKCFERMVKVNRKVHFTAASGASSNGRNSVYALFISDSANAGFLQYTWSYDMQYTDS